MADQSYTLQFTDPLNTIVVPPLTVDGPRYASTDEVYPNSSGSSTSLGLVGRGEPNYGRIVLNNMLQMLEHFSFPSAPVNPVVGQLWHNSDTDQLNLFTANGWVDVTGSDRFVERSGGTMTGTLVFPETTRLQLQYSPSSEADAINSKYANDTFLSKNGGTVVGSTNFTSRLSVTTSPTQPSDVINKQFLDQTIDDITLTTNRVSKVNGNDQPMSFGTAVSKWTEDQVIPSVSNSTFERAVVLGLSITDTVLPGQTIDVQSYGTIVADVNKWALLVGTPTGLQTGFDYFVSNESGKLTTNPTSTSGHFLTKVGTAVSSTVLVLDIQTPFRL